MKTTHLLTAVAVATLTGTADADVLLTVDLSVTNQVTITATNGVSSADISGRAFIGVYFENFFVNNNPYTTSTTVSQGTGNLTVAGTVSDTTPVLHRGDYARDPGLNMYNWTDDTRSTFTTGLVAFTGSATFALDSINYELMLPGGNRTGNLWFEADTFNDIPPGGGSATNIGQYTVTVPEPGSLALLSLGGLALLRRRR